MENEERRLDNKFAQYKKGDKVYYCEEGEISLVEVLENKCTPERLEYRLKVLEVVRPSWITQKNYLDTEFTYLDTGHVSSFGYAGFLDETGLSMLGLRRFTDEEKKGRIKQVQEKIPNIEKKILKKRQEYLESLNEGHIYAYQTLSGRKVVEIDGVMYANGESKGKAVIVGGLPPSQALAAYDSVAVFDPETIDKILPILEEGNLIIGLQIDNLPKEGIPDWYRSTPVQKIVKEKKENLAELGIEEICARMYQKLGESNGG